MTKQIRVLIACDTGTVTDRIKAELDAVPSVAAAHATSRDGFAQALADFEPAVVVCPLADGPLSVNDALELVRQFRPGAPVIAIGEQPDEHLLVTAMRAGAEDVLTGVNIGRLPMAIAAARVVRERLDRLTPRQLQVMRLVAEGNTTPQIADRLGLSHKTIETHRGEVLKRLGVHDVVGLVRYAVRVGLVEPR
jgi:DNA-binding NarL/FixJ family response regulator